MKTILITAAMAVAAWGAAAASETADTLLTAEQCRSMALANNAALKAADNNLRAAAETRREAFTKYFPEVSAGASAFRANHDMAQYEVLDLFTLGLFEKGKAAGIWALQPVFMGGQIVNGNRLARVGEEAAAIRREQSAADVALQTEALYWQLVTLKAERATLESALAVLDTLGRQVKVAVDAGVATNNDYLKVELKRNGYRADLVDLDNGIVLARMLLAQQTGLGPEARIDVAAEVPDEVPPCPDDIFMAPTEAMPSTYDHRLLVKNVEARELEKKMEVGANLPKLAVGAGWFYHDVFDQNHNFGAVMVTLSVPVSGWWGGSHAIKRKSLAVENARLELDDLSQKLEIEIADRWDDLTAAHRKMSLARASIDQSRENLRLTRAYYEAGMNTITDLLDAQTLDRKANDDYTAAYGAFRVARARYLDATGRL